MDRTKAVILFIIPRTPHHLRTPLRDMLWENTKKSLFNQTYHNWQALVIDDQDLIDGNLQYIASTAVRKGEKIQHALKIVESWENKPDYVIRLDDDDLIAPNALSYINDKNFDVAVDEYHTFFELKSGFFCQTRRPWFANTIIHKYEHAKSIMPDGRPLLDQDHSHVWHNYYSGKQIYKLPKEMPLYLRILSPGTVTSQQDDDYLNYVLSFGSWKKNLSLQKYFNSELFKRPIDHVFRLKMKLHPSAIKQMLKAILNSAQ